MEVEFKQPWHIAHSKICARVHLLEGFAPVRQSLPQYHKHNHVIDVYFPDVAFGLKACVPSLATAQPIVLLKSFIA